MENNTDVDARPTTEGDFSELDEVIPDEVVVELDQLSRLILLREIMSNQSGLFHSACSICEQYEKAVINHARLVVDAPTTSLLEDSKSILDVTHTIWIEHHIEDYRNHLEARRHHASIIERSMEESKPPPQTANDEEIHSLKTYIYTGDEKDEKQPCAICLNDFQSGEKIIETHCEHLFHDECLIAWLKTNISCPMCRKNAINGERIVVE